MKKKTFILLTSLLLLTSLIIGQAPIKANAITKESPKQLTVGYYPYYGDLSTVDVTKLTNLFFAFGYIYHNEPLPSGTSYDPSKTSDESLIGTIYLNSNVKSKLNKIPELKAKNKDLKVSLSIGGYAGRGFCDSTATKESRKKLVDSIVAIMNEYKLDGIDIDWEDPVNGGWGTIKACPEDKVNYTLLLQDLREALGKDKVITIAAGAGKDFRTRCTEFKKIGEIVDFITVMNYAYSYSGPKYDSPLFPSSKDPMGLNTDSIIKECIEAGVPKEKLVMGAAFFGKIPTDGNSPNYIDNNILISLGLTSPDFAYSYKQIQSLIGTKGIEERWDDEAKCPYLVYVDPQSNKEHFIMQYDNPKSMFIRGRYVKNQGLAGIMIWELTQDHESSLLNGIYKGLYTNLANGKTLDFNNDGKIDILDLSILSQRYNLSSEDPQFVDVFDLNDDKIVDIFDIALLATNLTE